MNNHKPQILAPAGDKSSFLAALAAGADAIYAGLKHYSARMQADNFSITELAALRELAAEKNCRVYIPMNTLVKPGEPESAGRLISHLEKTVKPDALIVQDLGLVNIARQAGYSGEIHLSTLANITHPEGIRAAREKLGVDRVILPRELNIDEIRQCADACPEGLDLEIFVHGALCYAVSGRCYWSSFFGGKSGLRGRCVQPCRRVYKMKKHEGRLFSCCDLSLDVLTRTLLNTPQVSCWKIEGRKKGPHYVYYTVAAYRTLRDGEGSSESKKLALDYLEQALGRPSTHYSFLPQKPHAAVTPDDTTASGRFVGKTSDARKGFYSVKPRFPLIKGDFLRIGFEDEPWHRTWRVTRDVPKGGKLDIKAEPGKMPQKSAAVYLIDRREPELLRLIKELEKELSQIEVADKGAPSLRLEMPKPAPRAKSAQRMDVWRMLPKGRNPGMSGMWLTPTSVRQVGRGMCARVWWWLPPVIWPNAEAAMQRAIVDALKCKAGHFVLNAPWQVAFFEKTRNHLELWAGPFCNTSNALALEELKKMGFSGAFVSPELTREDFMALPGQSPLPLGIVTGGQWPLCISRTKAKEMRLEEVFRSPRGEESWVRQYGQDYWVYPNWPLDISAELPELKKAGYSIFANLREPKPRNVPLSKRTSTFNLELRLL